MDKFTAIADEILFRRLDEIDGEFQDFHISAYKSDLLTKTETLSLEEHFTAQKIYLGLSLNMFLIERGTI